MNPYLQLGGMAAGLVASGVQNSAQKRDKRIAGGAEDPAIAALRQRLAAQNAQSAMRVAASQQGVNPALAQRNAQQALGQQQVQTNSMLAQQNAASTLQSRQADRRTQGQRVQGTIMGLAQGLNTLGTSLSADQASQAAMGQGPVTDPAEKAKFMEGGGALSAPPQNAAPVTSMVPESAAGLSAPPVPAAPAQPVNGTIPATQTMVNSMNEMSNAPNGSAMGVPQMRGAETSSGVPLQPATPAVAPVQTAPVQEAQMQAAPPAPPTVAAQDAAPAPMHWRDQWATLPPEAQNDPVNLVTLQTAEAYERDGQPELADRIMRNFYARL